MVYATFEGKSARSSSGPLLSAVALSTAFSSSRTLPGQSKASNSRHRGLGKLVRTSRSPRFAFSRNTVRQHGNVCLPFPQRWQLDLHYVDPEKQILPERSSPDLRLQIPCVAAITRTPNWIRPGPLAGFRFPETPATVSTANPSAVRRSRRGTRCPFAVSISPARVCCARECPFYVTE